VEHAKKAVFQRLVVYSLQRGHSAIN